MILRLRELREGLHLSQGACAEALGVSQNVLSQWEHEVALPRTRQLPLIASVLQCQIGDLFAEEAGRYCVQSQL